MPSALASRLKKCTCGNNMRALTFDLYHCAVCGRSAWGDDGISPGLIALIVILTILTIVVLGFVGASGAKYRA